MIDSRHRLLLLGVGLLALNFAGCNSTGGNSVTSWRPGFGWSGSAANGPTRTWNGPLVQPGTGLQPTPAMTSPPAIVPGTRTGPMLPDASANQYRPFPWATGIRYPQSPTRALPQQQRPVPQVLPQRGGPIAREASPSLQTPAELSGQIEIVPGPTLRARRARMELLPPPPGGTSAPPTQGTSAIDAEQIAPPAQPLSE